MTTLRGVHIIVLMTVLAVGCASTNASKKAPLPSAGQASGETPSVANREGSAVLVLDFGSEPRAPLRYRFPQGGSAQRLVVQLGIGGLLESQESRTKVDDVMLELGVTMGVITQVADDLWTCPVRFEVVGLSVPDGTPEDQRADILKRLEPLTMASASFEIDGRGLTHEVVLSVPAAVPQRLLALLGNVRTSLITAPFPLEPVGVGARWQVKRLVDVGPIQVAQTATYTLLEQQDSTLRIGLTVQQSANPQELFLDADGTKLSVETYQMSSEGSRVVDLDRIVPLGELRGTSELRAVYHRDGHAEPIALSGAMFVNVVPANDAPSAATGTQAP